MNVKSVMILFLGVFLILFFLSNPLSVNAECPDDPCGENRPLNTYDANVDQKVDVADAITILNYLFTPNKKDPYEIDCFSCCPECPPCDSCCPECPYITIILPGGVPLEMNYCPPGTFMMGAYPGEQDRRTEEDPQHQVMLTKGFYLGKYEVTKAQWEAVMETRPWEGKNYVLDDPDSPVVYVSWEDVAVNVGYFLPGKEIILRKNTVC